MPKVKKLSRIAQSRQARSLTDEDVASAVECMRRAGVLDLVESMRGTFAVEDILSELRSPPRLNALRRKVWAAVYDRRGEDGKRLHSTPELGRLFNREHSTILAGIKVYHAAIEANRRVEVP